MELMKNPLAVIVMLAASITLSTSTIQSSDRRTTGKLKGTIMDSNGAAIGIPKPTIAIKGRQIIRKVVPDENGAYEIELPAGIYQISAEIDGFYPFRRAAFRVQPGATTVLNIVPTMLYLVRGTTVSTKEPIDTPLPPPKYDLFSIPQLLDPLSLLIEFDKKRTLNGTVRYDRATLSYDVLTIYADKIRFNKKTLRVETFGEYVIVEDGKQRIQVKRAEVGFKGGEPILKLTQ